ncbi:MAG: MATE family efflux transporter, partial [Bacteroidaceae bacterium]|nr:MATE family efflux transporter [Bacteroidaceae bacterium]
MTTAPVRGLILKLAMPTVVSMLITAIYNMATTFYVGRLSTEATAAVGVAFAAMAIIQAVGFFFGQGSGNAISRHLGARETKQAAVISATGFFVGIVVAALLAACALLGLTPLCRLLGATNTIMPHTIEYLTPILAGAPIMTAALTLNNQLRFQGNALLGMMGIASGSILNIGLQPLFIFALDMGLHGAAICTVLCQSISLIILLHLNTRYGSVPLSIRATRLNRNILAEIARGGLPSLARQGL